jgi:hypothetical protein
MATVNEENAAEESDHLEDVEVVVESIENKSEIKPKKKKNKKKKPASGTLAESNASDKTIVTAAEANHVDINGEEKDGDDEGADGMFRY